MNLAYTDSFSVSTEIIIKKGSTPGNGVIPDSISVSQISIVSNGNGSFYVKGLHTNAAWAEVETGAFVIEGIDDNSSMYFYIKADAATTMNLFVKGQI